MNNHQIHLLSKMKRLINQGYCRFEQRSDRDYVASLFELGLTEEEAWKEILLLNVHYYFYDLKPDYLKSDESLIFKKIINGQKAYIKLKIEVSNNHEETVCLSFHVDNK